VPKEASVVPYGAVRVDHRDKVGSDGTQNLLAAIHFSGPGNGPCFADLVEPGAYIAAAGVLLVGRLQERMVRLSDNSVPPKKFQEKTTILLDKQPSFVVTSICTFWKKYSQERRWFL